MAASGRSRIQIIENKTGTSLKFRVFPPDAGAYNYTEIHHALATGKELEHWYVSAQEDGNDQIEISTHLVKNKLYVFIPFRFDSAPSYEPGLPVFGIPTDLWTPWTEIVPALKSVLEALGVAKVYYGRVMPQKFRSPAALIETHPRTERIGTNEGSLEIYPVSVTFQKRGKDKATSQTMKAKIEHFVDQLKFWMHRTIDYPITNLQLVTAHVVSVDTWDYDVSGVEAGIRGIVNVSFQIWRSYRRDEWY